MTKIPTNDWRKDYVPESNRPRPTEAISDDETPMQFILRMFHEGKLRYDDGEIYSLYDNRGKGSWREEPKNVGIKDSRGYVDYRFRFNGGWASLSIHRIVYSLFNGANSIPKGMQINHKDGNKSNNKIENLEICTPKENTEHAVRTGLRNPENTNTAKLDWEKVREIRKKRSEGETNVRLAEYYGVHKSTISKIIRGVTWKEYE